MVACGIKVFESLYQLSKDNNVLNIDDSNFIGNHSVLIVSCHKDGFGILNSHGRHPNNGFLNYHIITLRNMQMNCGSSLK